MALYGDALYGEFLYGGDLPVVPSHKVEFFLSGAWTTAPTRQSQPIRITTGRSPESSQTNPSSLTFTLPNLDGRYSSKNPLGIYYGQFKRGVPVRFSVDTGIMRLSVPVTDADNSGFGTAHRATCPSAAALNISGDLDLRVERSGRFDGLQIAKTNAYYLSIDSSGLPTLQWYDASANLLRADATDFVPTQERWAVRAVLDVDNGSAGNTVTFYTSPTLTGAWTQLGSAVVQSGTTSIRTSLEGGVIGGGADSFTYAGQILSGIAGTVVASPDFTVQAEGTTSFTDSAGRLWTVNGRSSVTSWSQRFNGFVSELQPAWDRSQQDATMEVTASGVLRRLNQSARVDQSPYYKGMFARNPVAYWPMEDATGSTSIAPATSGTATMVFGGGASLANSSAFIASQPLPAGSGGYYTAPVPAGYPNPNTEIQFRYLMQVDPALAATTVLARIRTDGTLSRFDVCIEAASNLMVLRAYSNEVLVASSSVFVMSTYQNVPVRWSVELKQNGTGVNFNLVALKQGDTSGVSFGIVTVASQTLGRATSVGLNSPGSTVVGHQSVENAISSIFDLADVLNAYVGEQAAARAVRIGLAAGADTQLLGGELGSSMGPEPILDLVSKLQQSVDADDGLLIESRSFPGLYYRARNSMASLQPGLRLSYGSLNEQTAPVEDDQLTVNDQTVSRDGGSSARFQLTTGPLSTQDSPNGVGRFSQSSTLNLQLDSQLIHHAAWRVHLGTMDEPRFPTVSIDLHSPYLQAYRLSVYDLQVGDWIALTNPPVWWPPQEVRQQVFQITETITAETYNVTLSGRPARANNVGLYSTPLARFDSNRSILHSTMSVGGTVATIDGQGDAWITDAVFPSMFPFNITVSGEVMRVTACSLIGGFYLMTVTRSINGVLKAHAIGDTVSLAEPSYWGI